MKRLFNSWRRYRNRALIVSTAAATLLFTAAPASSVVGGSVADIGETPWVVSIRIDQDGFEWNCAGALIAPAQVMTAARCVSGFDLATIRVVAGQGDRGAGGGTAAKIRTVWVHPGYSDDDVIPKNDIAVLTLARDLPQTPIKLAPSIFIGGSPYTAGNPATLAGWGSTTREGSTYSSKLNSAILPVVSSTVCEGQAGYVAGKNFCAGDAKGGVDACFGDTGAPLVAKNMLIGITSYGVGCGEPGQYTLFTKANAYSLSTDVRQPAIPIVNQNSRQCLAIPAGSTVPGETSVQWGCLGLADQQWSARPVPDTPYVEIVNANSHLCLSINGGSQVAGESAIQWECNGNTDQHWTKQVDRYQDGEAVYTLVNRGSGQCLAIWQASTDQGQKAVQWPCADNADHRWTW
ncbi:trypsin-like serine protease [Kitasatospora sp. NPDC005751]|uniref:trypsin-like serine protease n=1 Tax=Kitasatospora sp. NPDC005751 TaxID=3157064 RepID=UPI0033D2AE18